ncbi:MAG: isoprenylcysteine carboxylmethyltransferase family protein [Acidobacteria bacterium]|nr:isoprenylcysteine carboxylmethyltransferase family protein [Acidobacteriota bacterium]
MDEPAAAVIRILARRRIPIGFLAAVLVLALAVPSWVTWTAGLLTACAGEAIRIWAAGHLEKGREVTRSGPYRFTGHPLYVGSTVIAGGVALAAQSALVAALIAVYMGLTIAAAVRTEEADLRRAFGSVYEDYLASRAAPMARRFSLARARRNREYRAVVGLVAGFALLALKIVTRP